MTNILINKPKKPHLEIYRDEGKDYFFYDEIVIALGKESTKVAFKSKGTIVMTKETHTLQIEDTLTLSDIKGVLEVEVVS